MSVPVLSVVLPVRNAAAFLDAAIASILAQDFTDFELIALDDASTDGSDAILRRWAARDHRVRLDHSAVRLGAAGSSNRVVELARAPLVARMDADDVMLPGRLSAQIRVFERAPGTVLTGGLAWTVDASGRRVRAPDLARIIAQSRFAPFPHSTIMFRRSAWQQCGGYRSEAEKWEDIDFFLRMAQVGSVRTLAVPLVEYRQHLASTRFGEGLPALERAMDAMWQAATGAKPRRPAQIAVGAYRHIGATWLWSLGRPALLGRLIRKADLRPNLESLAMLGWALAAQLSPSLLRSVLRARLAFANHRARRKLCGRTLIVWTPAPIPLD